MVGETHVEKGWKWQCGVDWTDQNVDSDY